MISREDVKKLATLSRISLSLEEEVALAKDMEGILGYVGQLLEVDTKKDKKERKPEGLYNVMREDNAPDEAGCYSANILKESPKTRGDYIIVKKIF